MPGTCVGGTPVLPLAEPPDDGGGVLELGIEVEPPACPGDSGPNDWAERHGISLPPDRRRPTTMASRKTEFQSPSTVRCGVAYAGRQNPGTIPTCHFGVGHITGVSPSDRDHPTRRRALVGIENGSRVLRDEFPETREQRCWFHRSCTEYTCGHDRRGDPGRPATGPRCLTRRLVKPGAG